MGNGLSRLSSPARAFPIGRCQMLKRRAGMPGRPHCRLLRHDRHDGQYWAQSQNPSPASEGTQKQKRKVQGTTMMSIGTSRLAERGLVMDNGARSTLKRPEEF